MHNLERRYLKIKCPKKNKEYDINEMHGNHCPFCGAFVDVQQILAYYAMGNPKNNDNNLEQRIRLLRDDMTELKKEFHAMKAKQQERRRLEEERRKKNALGLETVQTVVIFITMIISLISLYIGVNFINT